MIKTLRIIGTVLLLAAMLIGPARADVSWITPAPMMEMADGSPCMPKDCATMPDCTMALPGGVGAFAIPTSDASALLLPKMSSDVFDMTEIAESALIHGDGLRRPPKI